ncbi:winged helix DNA-binding domain-containing protein [Chitinophaga arvensicola]|uniref:Winged helix DNA-binding domain-containing protein n=1 Tax=Chitinophaga arvensicola TaxID=29529 RepID=A0A1I0SBG9_9BACT|nr:winged helix DNA-binding domain-containing protein [Chitinophaga arvensicola]SEW53959.1 Winged helix DNA-binding domain-containing protein [Chitinophaga arvensicola]
MNSPQIAKLRQQHQQLLHSHFTRPAELIQWMGCVQAQDYAGAKWAIGNRVQGSTDASIEKDFNEGRLLRTHVLRPTWHFVAPEDIGWMLQLTAPRIKAFNKRLHEKLGISEKDLHRSRTILGQALSDQPFLTRTAILPLLHKAKINTDDIRLGFLLMDAELEGLICSGPRQGKQFTYALLANRAASTPILERDEAIAQLTLRYFRSRGPATVTDFQWWSGLNMADIKTGLVLNKTALHHIVTNGQAYWFTREEPVKPAPATLLLPAYDEYAVAYKDRSDILPATKMAETGYGIFKPVIVVNGQVVGTWSRKESRTGVEVSTQMITPGSKTTRVLEAAISSYAAFLGKNKKEMA